MNKIACTYHKGSEYFSLEETLVKIAEHDYQGVELGPVWMNFIDGRQLKSLLQQLGLSLSGIFMSRPLSDLESETRNISLNDIRKVCQKLNSIDLFPNLILSDSYRTVESRLRNAGRVTSDHILSKEQWKRLADNLNKIGYMTLSEYGINTIIQNRCASYIETPVEIEICLELTDSRYVGFGLNAGHFIYGGAHGIELALEKHLDRIQLVYFTDCSLRKRFQAALHRWNYPTAIKEGIFCPIGKGLVDFPALVAALYNSGYEGWMVVENFPFTSQDYLKRLQIL